MSVDIDTYLRQHDPNFDVDSSHDVDDSGQNKLEMDDFEVHGDYIDNSYFDVFGSNNVNGGHGSLSYSNNLAQEQFVAPSAIDGYAVSKNTDNNRQYQVSSAPFDANGHASSQNLQYANGYHGFVAPSGLDSRSIHHKSQHGHEQQQDVVSSNFDGHGFNHNVQQPQDTTAVFAHNGVEDVTDSIEYEDNDVEEDVAEDEVPLKNEQHDSDEESEEGDEEGDAGDEDEEDDDGQGKKKKRKSYSKSRCLIRWHTGKDQLALMALVYELELKGIEIPWGRVCQHIEPKCNPNGDALTQHLLKARKARIYYGLAVPPPRPKREVKGQKDPDTLDKVTQKEIKIWNTITYVKPGSDAQSDATPGTVAPMYTPLPIDGRPDLPHYNATTKTIVNRSRTVTQTPARAPRAPKTNTASSKKKENTTKVIKAEEEEDAPYIDKPTSKGKSTPAASKRKTATKAASKSTPAKPTGVTKPRKTPSTIIKKMSTMMVDSSASELGVTPSKRAGPPKRKAKANGIPEAEESSDMEPASVAADKAKKPVAQSYGRVNVRGPAVPVQSFESMRAGLPADRFQMRGHQPNQSFDSQSTVSTAPSLSMPNNQTQFMPISYDHSLQNGFPTNNYGHQMMQGSAPSFAHGHNLSSLSREELANMNPEEVKQRLIHSLSQQQAHAPMPLQQQQQYPNTNVNSHNSGPHGLGIMNAPALMLREPLHLDPQLGDYSFASGPASGMPSQQQFFSVTDADVQAMANDSKPNMEQYSGDYTDLTDFDVERLFGDDNLH